MADASVRARRAATAAALAALCAASGCGGEDEPAFAGPRHVLLVSLDTLRRDATSLYAPELGTTPFLAELAAERGVVFENHMVNSNNTLTSHATMLTGLLMTVHGAEDAAERSALAPEHVSVAERFAEHGFATAAFAEHELWISRDFGLDQGFARFESEWRSAPETSARFLDWIASEKPRRMFAFLHFYDAHSESASGALPYSAPPEYLERFAPPPPEGFAAHVTDENGRSLVTSAYLQYHHGPARPLPAGYAEYLRGCYHAGVAKLDADLAALFGELDELGILDETLVVVTSDHGEEFKEHGGTLHNSYFDEIMRVPLLVVPPAGSARPRARVADLSRCVDIAPTLLDYAGLPPLSPCQGRSLRPAMEGQELPYAPTLFGRAILRDKDATSEYKVGLFKESPVLYDLAADPGELENIFRSERERAPERILEIWDRAQDLRRENDLLRAAIGATRAEGPALNPRQLAELEALGYVGLGDAAD